MKETIQNVLGVEEQNWNAVNEYISKVDSLQLDQYYTNMIHTDIKHMAFTLCRYKFVSKLLMYNKNVKLLELGCQEALGALLLKQGIMLSKYVGVDLDNRAIEWNKRNLPGDLEFVCANFLEGHQFGEDYDVVVSLDVIEHISSEMEDKFCEVICSSIQEKGMAVVGTPNIMLQPYASEGSKIAHINLYDQNRLYKLMNKYFHNVFIFNMNDEIVNTGFAPMSCYIFALCCNMKK